MMVIPKKPAAKRKPAAKSLTLKKAPRKAPAKKRAAPRKSNPTATEKSRLKSAISIAIRAADKVHANDIARQAAISYAQGIMYGGLIVGAITVSQHVEYLEKLGAVAAKR